MLSYYTMSSPFFAAVLQERVHHHRPVLGHLPGPARGAADVGRQGGHGRALRGGAHLAAELPGEVHQAGAPRVGRQDQVLHLQVLPGALCTSMSFN